MEDRWNDEKSDSKLEKRRDKTGHKNFLIDIKDVDVELENVKPKMRVVK